MSDHFSLSEDEINTKLNDLTKIINSFSNLSKEKTESALDEAKDLSAKIEKILNQMKIECSTLSASDPITMKLRNYNSEFESLRSRINKMEEEYVINKSQHAFNSQNIKFEPNRSKEKVNESSRLLLNIDSEIYVTSSDKTLNLELMKHYTTNEDPSKYQQNEIKTNQQERKRYTILIIIIAFFLVILFLLTILFFAKR